MKLLTISSLYYPYVIGGAENSTRMIAEGMINFGFSSVVITIAPEEKIEEVNGVKVYYVTKRNLYHFFPKRAQRPGPIRLLWHLIDLYNPWMEELWGEYWRRRSQIWSIRAIWLDFPERFGRLPKGPTCPWCIRFETITCSVPIVLCTRA